LIGARLIAERERACDESVLAAGHDAEVYAGAILKVCRFCVQSPLACVSGASGADLGRRIRQIMSDDTVLDIGHAQKALLAGALAVALGLPVAGGFVAAPPLMAAVRERVSAGIVQVASDARQIAVTPIVRFKIRRPHKWKIAALAEPRQMPPPAQQLAEAPSLPAAAPADATAGPAMPPPQPMPAAAPPQHAGVKEVIIALYPQGTGDPDAVTCRSPEALPGSRLPGPQVCQTNRQWASLRARHEDITPDGQGIIMPDGTEMQSGFAVLNCAMGRVSGNGISNALGVPASVCF
jgi:hypothetical protein